MESDSWTNRQCPILDPDLLDSIRRDPVADDHGGFLPVIALLMEMCGDPPSGGMTAGGSAAVPGDGRCELSTEA
jgi:hypothetical protein